MFTRRLLLIFRNAINGLIVYYVAGRGGVFYTGCNFKMPPSERGVFLIHVLSRAYESLTISLAERLPYNR